MFRLSFVAIIGVSLLAASVSAVVPKNLRLRAHDDNTASAAGGVGVSAETYAGLQQAIDLTAQKASQLQSELDRMGSLNDASKNTPEAIAQVNSLRAEFNRRRAAAAAESGLSLTPDNHVDAAPAFAEIDTNLHRSAAAADTETETATETEAGEGAGVVTDAEAARAFAEVDTDMGVDMDAALQEVTELLGTDAAESNVDDATAQAAFAELNTDITSDSSSNTEQSETQQKANLLNVLANFEAHHEETLAELEQLKNVVDKSAEEIAEMQAADAEDRDAA